MRTHFSNGPTLPTEKHNTQTDMNHGDTTCFFLVVSVGMRKSLEFIVVCVCVTVCMCVTDSTVVWWLALSPHSREVQGPSVWRLDVLSGHLGFKDTL